MFTAKVGLGSIASTSNHGSSSSSRAGLVSPATIYTAFYGQRSPYSPSVSPSLRHAAMALHQLPPEVWVSVVRYGDLTVDDVFSISSTSTGLRRALHNEIIWEEIFYHEWGHIVADYELDLPVPQYRQVCLLLRYKRDKLVRRAESAPIRSNKEMSSFLDRHMEVEFLVAALRLYRDHEQKLRSGSPVDFRLMFVLNTLIIRHNYAIAMPWIYQNLHTESYDHDYERFWFKMGHFGREFHRHAHRRSLALTRIRKTVYSEFIHEILYNGSNPKIRLEQTTIHFASTGAYVKFIKTFTSVILGSMSFFSRTQDHAFNLSSDQGHNIISVYTGIVPGEPMILYSIIVKLFREFLGHFQLKIGNKPKQPFQARVTAQFIKLQDYYLGLEKDPRSGLLTVPVMLSAAAYKVFLARTMNFSISDGRLEPFLNPIGFSHLMEYYKSTVLQFGTIAIDNGLYSPIDVKTHQELNFIKSILRFLSLQSISGYSAYLICVELHQCLVELDNSIHTSTLMSLFASQDLSTLNEYLTMSDSRYEFNRHSAGHLQPGSLVYHHDKNDVGVFIAYRRDAYCKVLQLGSRWDEVVAESSLSVWKACPHDKLDIYYKFGFDILGLYFKGWDESSNLVPYEREDIEDSSKTVQQSSKDG